MFPSRHKPADSLGSGMQVVESQGLQQGLRCFEERGARDSQVRGAIRTFEKANRQSGVQVGVKGKRTIDFNPTTRREQAQRCHVIQDTCNKEMESRGIKTFEGLSGKTESEYALETRLQQKARVNQLSQKRNGLEVMAQGDKSYKVSQNSTDFYRSGGLIPGSTIRNKKGLPPDQITIVPFTRPNYDQMVKIREAQEDRKQLEGLEAWQEATFKQGYPTKDPTKVEKQDSKKDTKKAPKK